MASNAKIVLNETTELRDGTTTSPVIERKTADKEIEVSEYIDRLIAVGMADSDVGIDFGGLTTGKFIRIETNNPIQVKIDGTGSPLRTITSIFIWEGEFTSLHVSGNGSSDAVAKFTIGGE